MDAPIITIKNATKTFNGRTVVDDFNLTVRRGEVVALLGQTGAGKTTILNLILGQIAPTTGEVRVEGFDPVRDADALRGKVAVSFQFDRLIPWRTARRNVELGLEILYVDKEARAARATEWLNRVKLHPVHHEKYPHQLSGGMRQRVSLARAMVIDPDLVLLDESFSQLDPVTSKALRADVLALVKQFGKTCVLITHRIEDALEMADRLFLLAAPGRVRHAIGVSESDRGNAAWLASTTAAIAHEMTAAQAASDQLLESGVA